MRAERGPYGQHVRRPSGAVVVDELTAAFAALSRDERGRIGRWSLIESTFSGGVRPEVSGEQGLAAAVVVPFVRTGEEAEVVLIRRSHALRSNPGDVAFPGGRIEPGETAAAAAVREAHEEVALEPSRLRLLEALAPVTRASRTGRIAVFIAAVDGRPRLVPNPAEVEACLVAPISELADPDRYWEERWVAPDGTTWMMPFFDRGEDVIWGATARILVTLLDRLAAVTRLPEGG